MRDRIGHKKEMKNAQVGDIPAQGNPREILETYVKDLDGVANAGKPSMVFLYAGGKVGRDHAFRRSMDNAVENSRVVQQHVLHSIPAFTSDSTQRAISRFRPSTNHDFRAAIGSKYFNTVQVNLFSVDPNTHPVMNGTNMPLIVFTNEKGEVAEILSGPGLRPATVFKTMTKIMQDQGYENFAKQVMMANKCMNLMYKAETDMRDTQSRRNSQSNQDKIAKLKEWIATCQKEYEDSLAAITKSEKSDAETVASNQ